MDIKILRLLSGEEIIGEIQNEDETHFQIREPYRVGMVPTAKDENGNPTGNKLMMVPYLPLAPDGEVISIRKSDIKFTHGPTVDCISLYKQATSSLVLPPSGMTGNKIVLKS